MRVSSLTCPSSMGTLKSTRTRTRLPAGSKSRTVSLSMAQALGDAGVQPSGHEVDEVRDAAAVAPLVVVPGDDLDQVATHGHRAGGVDDRGACVALEVDGHERVVRDAQDALRADRRRRRGRPRCSSSTRGRALELGGEVDDAHGGRRHAQAEAVELALEVGDDERQRLGGAGRGRDDVQAGGAGAARVLVGHVEDVLVVGVGVDGVHQAALDDPAVVDDLGRRRQAVGGAAGVADDVVLRRVVLVLVDAQDDGDVLVLGGRADDDLPGARVEMRGGLGRVREAGPSTR